MQRMNFITRSVRKTMQGGGNEHIPCQWRTMWSIHSLSFKCGSVKEPKACISPSVRKPLQNYFTAFEGTKMRKPVWQTVYESADCVSLGKRHIQKCLHTRTCQNAPSRKKVLVRIKLSWACRHSGWIPLKTISGSQIWFHRLCSWGFQTVLSILGRPWITIIHW